MVLRQLNRTKALGIWSRSGLPVLALVLSGLEDLEKNLEKSQQPAAGSAIVARPDEEEVVGLVWLPYLVDQRVVTWAI